MISPAGNTQRFGILFGVAHIVLITSHSNAGIERVYSLVNKSKLSKTERNRLDIDGILASTLAVKLDRPESVTKCYDFMRDTQLLSASKSAVTNYNRQHSNKI